MYMMYHILGLFATIKKSSSPEASKRCLKASRCLEASECHPEVSGCCQKQCFTQLTPFYAKCYAFVTK